MDLLWISYGFHEDFLGPPGRCWEVLGGPRTSPESYEGYESYNGPKSKPDQAKSNQIQIQSNQIQIQIKPNPNPIQSKSKSKSSQIKIKIKSKSKSNKILILEKSYESNPRKSRVTAT